MSRGILIVGAGVFQVPVIETARAMGLRVVAVDGDPDAPGLRLADEPHAVDFSDAAAVVEVARRAGVAAVTTVASEVAVPAVAAVAEALGLPGLSPAAARNVTDKEAMRRSLADAGAPCPRFVAARTGDEARAGLQRFGLPVVVKPVDSSGSRGVSLVSAEEELLPAFERALSRSRRRAALVEEFLDGPELAVEGLIQERRLSILALSDKTRTSPPHLLDTVVSFPARLTPEEEARVEAVASQAVAATGLDDAALHLELIRTPDGPKVVELAGRGAGFNVFTHIVPWVAGDDVIAALIRVALGEPHGLRQPLLRRGAVLSFPPFPPGEVTGVSGLEEARALEGIAAAEIHVAVGERVAALTSGADRPAHVIAFGEDRAQAEQRAAAAVGVLRVETA